MGNHKPFRNSQKSGRAGTCLQPELAYSQHALRQSIARKQGGDLSEVADQGRRQTSGNRLEREVAAHKIHNSAQIRPSKCPPPTQNSSVRRPRASVQHLFSCVKCNDAWEWPLEH